MEAKKRLGEPDALKLALEVAQQLYAEQARLHSDVRTKSTVGVTFISLGSALLALDAVARQPLWALLPSLLLLGAALVFAFPGLVSIKRPLSVSIEAVRKYARELDHQTLACWQLGNYSKACDLLRRSCAFAGHCVTASIGLSAWAVVSLAILAIARAPTETALLVGHASGLMVVFSGILLRNATTLLGTEGEV